MIGYVVIGTSDLPRAQKFYDELLSVLGAKRVMELGDRGTAWGDRPGQAHASGSQAVQR